MTDLSRLDELHAAHDLRFPASLSAARWHDAIDNAWPAISARIKALEAAALNVSVAARKDVGVARLSKDELAWECPVCGAGEGVHKDGSDRSEPCKTGCTRNAMLAALDDLDAALARARTDATGGQHD